MPVTAITWQNVTNATVDGTTGDLVKTGGSDLCASAGTGDAGARSNQTITGGDWKFEISAGPLGQDFGRTYVGLKTGSYSADYTTWPFAIYVSSEAESPYPANTIHIYESGTHKIYLEGDVAAGDLLQIICINGVVRYYINSRLLYTSSATPSYPMRAVVSMACPNSSVLNASFVDGLDLAPKASCGILNCTPQTSGSIQIQDENLVSGITYFSYPNTYPNTYALWIKLYEDVPADHPSFGGVNTKPLAAIISNHGGGRFFLGLEREDDATTKLVFGGAASNGGTPLNVGPTMALDTWYHLAIASGAGSPGTRKIYLNGELVINATGTDALIFNQYIGNDNSLRPAPIFLTDLKVWTDEKSQSDIQTEYNAACYEVEVTSNIWSFFPLDTTDNGYIDQESNASISAGDQLESTDKPTSLSWCTDPCQPSRGGGTDCASSEGSDTGDSCSASWTIPTPSAFPTSPSPLYFDELETDWGEFGQKYPDGTPQYNTIQTAAIRRFAVEWGGLSKSEALAIDAHWASTRGGLGFTLVNPHTGESISGVRYETYERSSHVRVWAQTRSAKLVKYTS